jgi:hypothetical protein
MDTDCTVRPPISPDVNSVFYVGPSFRFLLDSTLGTLLSELYEYRLVAESVVHTSYSTARPPISAEFLYRIPDFC